MATIDGVRNRRLRFASEGGEDRRLATVIRMRRLYVYKLTTDNGGAPHVKHRLLSLAICKPSIRRTAQQNDWLFGFGGDALGERLIYIARVTTRLTDGLYYVDPKYRGRADRIYRRDGDRFVLRSHARYHKQGDQITRDLGRWPQYRDANVLVSRDFRYWGKSGTTSYQGLLPEIVSLLRRLTRGHRVKLSNRARNQLLELQRAQWRKHPKKRVLGGPSQTDYRRACNHSEGSIGSVPCGPLGSSRHGRKPASRVRSSSHSVA